MRDTRMRDAGQQDARQGARGCVYSWYICVAVLRACTLRLRARGYTARPAGACPRAPGHKPRWRTRRPRPSPPLCPHPRAAPRALALQVATLLGFEGSRRLMQALVAGAYLAVLYRAVARAHPVPRPAPRAPRRPAGPAGPSADANIPSDRERASERARERESEREREREREREPLSARPSSLCREACARRTWMQAPRNTDGRT